MNRNPERKVKYVQVTSDILEQEGVEGVTIRKVAERAHCTSAVLYKHFNDKDHLIMLASIRFLEPYISEFLKQNARRDLSSLQMDLLLWKTFIDEAFRNRPYYELMFFGDKKETLEDCVYEYYQMFPSVQRQFDGLTASIVFSGNLVQREHIRLRRAVVEGDITSANALLLAQLSVAVFNGIFVQDRGSGEKEEDARSASEHCYGLIKALFEQFSNPGTKLEADGE